MLRTPADPPSRRPLSAGRDRCRYGSPLLRQPRRAAAGSEQVPAIPRPAPAAAVPSPGIAANREPHGGTVRGTRSAPADAGPAAGPCQTGRAGAPPRRAAMAAPCSGQSRPVRAPTAIHSALSRRRRRGRGAARRSHRNGRNADRADRCVPHPKRAARTSAPMPAAAARPERRAHAIAGGGEGQVHRLAAPTRDTVARSADPLDLQLDRVDGQLLSSSAAQPTRPRRGERGIAGPV